MPNTSHCQMGDKEAGASEKGPNAEDDDSPNQTQRRYKFVLNKNRFHTFLSFCRRILVKLFISLKDLCTKNTALPCYAYIFVLGSHSVSIPSFVILKKAQN